MYKQILEEDIIKKQAKEILRYIFTSGIILMSIFIIRIFMVFNHKDYVYSIEMFIRQVNGAISIISIISCLILYKKTKDSIVFTLMLVYVGLSIAIITGQFNHYEFLNNKFIVSNYISIITVYYENVVSSRKRYIRRIIWGLYLIKKIDYFILSQRKQVM